MELINGRSVSNWEVYQHIMAENNIVSIHIEHSTTWDRLMRHAREFTYVVEHVRTYPTEYGGYKQKRHQRRYADLPSASRRLDYILAKYAAIEKAFILDFPIDVAYYRHKALESRLKCLSCGGTRWTFNDTGE